MGEKTRAPSMHDVAARAGVSHQTVSRVLNDFSGIRPETRERVQEAIQALGYRRNVAARTLVTGRSQAVGVIAPAQADYGPMSLMYAIQGATTEAGLHPLITMASDDAEGMADALEFLLGRNIDALVVIAQYPSAVELVESAVSDLPTAYVWNTSFSGDLAVAVDQVHGTRLALEHLYELGHRRLQHIAGSLASGDGIQRKVAFDAFIDERGLERFEALEGDWSSESGYREGLRIDPSVTGVFVGNDQMSQGVLHALSTRGVDVPGDVSVVGFDDIPEAAHFVPPLTTVHQDFTQVGHEAVARVVARLAGDDERVPVAPLPWLVERESTAPPRG